MDVNEFQLPAGKLVVASSSALDKEAQLNRPGESTIKCYQQKVGNALQRVSGVDIVVYVGFIVTHDGQVKHIEPYEEDEYGFHTVAAEIIRTCCVTFEPGILEGKPVDSWVYFPIQFKK